MREGAGSLTAGIVAAAAPGGPEGPPSSPPRLRCPYCSQAFGANFLGALRCGRHMVKVHPDEARRLVEQKQIVPTHRREEQTVIPPGALLSPKAGLPDGESSGEAGLEP